MLKVHQFVQCLLFIKSNKCNNCQVNICKLKRDNYFIRRLCSSKRGLQNASLCMDVNFWYKTCHKEGSTCRANWRILAIFCDLMTSHTSTCTHFTWLVHSAFSWWDYFHKYAQSHLYTKYSSFMGPFALLFNPSVLVKILHNISIRNLKPPLW